jgi:hypothetical protein
MWSIPIGAQKGRPMRDSTYLVYVSGTYKGEAYVNPRSNKWTWFKSGRGKQQFPKGATLETVRDHLATLCRTDRENVTFQIAYY